ncbi:hypothetical protein ID866_3023 [Astraeus odoratus]|nr:hypothetical protein ID866_3023 [Astraeus odoratus]
MRWGLSSDEIIEIIIYELDDPTALTLTSKRFLRVSQDPYVRAQYFLTRYGHMDAMFWALGRGKLLSEKVIDILIASGAHVSRYLVQVAIHHFYRSAVHFIKTTWVRSMRLEVFSYFQKVAAEMFDEMPVGKNEDDGYIFSAFLKESRLPSHLRSKKWEDIRDILQKYRFIPFSMKDPLMVQLPIALAVEPRLLPYAEANGFRMDTKYRDFIFRKMFEKQALNSVDRTDEIVRNVRELKRLDARMFLSRTVAAEVCMEAKSNESAYRALKTLDRAGDLLFPLSNLVTDLIKVNLVGYYVMQLLTILLLQLFIKTRAIMTGYTINVVRQLYADFPTADPTVRTVMLLTVFLFDGSTPPASPLTSVKSKLEALGLLPVVRQDLMDLLINPFIERPSVLLDYAREEMGMGREAMKDLALEATLRCLGVCSKGKTIKKLVETYDLEEALVDTAVQRYSLSMADLPPSEDEQACAAYEAPLCRDFNTAKSNRGSSGSGSVRASASGFSGVEGSSDEMHEGIAVEANEGETTDDELDLGTIGQDTLSSMIRQDEMSPTRSRRRSYYYNMYSADTTGKLTYPADFLQVGRWVQETYLVSSPLMALFLTHAVVNNNNTLLHIYLSSSTPSYPTPTAHVPITLKHFKLLAHLGRAPNFCLYHEIELGAEFYFSEEDYLSKQGPMVEIRQIGKYRVKADVKKETSPASILHSTCQPDPLKSTPPIPSPPRISRRRPRRSTTAAITSYAIPDSDDDAIVEDDDENAMVALMSMQAKKRKVESNLQRWIKHLSALLAEEQRKYKEKRKRLEKTAPADCKLRVNKVYFPSHGLFYLQD